MKQKTDKIVIDMNEVEPLYTRQQPRQPLTDEQITQICTRLWSGGWRAKAMKDFARAIERAHGIADAMMETRSKK